MVCFVYVVDLCFKSLDESGRMRGSKTSHIGLRQLEKVKGRSVLIRLKTEEYDKLQSSIYE